MPHIPSMEPRCRAVNEESPAFRRGECQELKQFLSGLTLSPRDNAIRNMNNYNIRMLKKEMKKRDETLSDIAS